jgi:perosamine synthetase
MIPLTRPLLGPEEETAVQQVLRSGMLVQGAKVAELEALVAAYTGRRHAIAVDNGTTALQLALTAIGVGKGDAVLCPDLTWPSPAHAIIDCGAEPVLVDVDPAEWNAGPTQFAAARSETPRAVIAIDQLGNPSRVHEIARALPGVPLIVDAACSLGSRVGESACGALGVIACTSFHPRKVITTGEGGMCLTDDDALADALRELRNHGQVAPGRFGRASGNHRMSELAAAVGVVQMGRLAGIVEARAALGARYEQAFASLPISLQQSAPGSIANRQTLGVVLGGERAPGERDRVIEELGRRGVQAGLLSHAVHRLPHMARYAQAAQRQGRGLEASARIVAHGLALPLYPSMSPAQQQQVIDAVHAVIG